MPIDQELLEFAKTIHDDLERLDMPRHAAAIRLAVDVAVHDQEVEDEIGEENVRALIEAISHIRSKITRIASADALTYGQLGDALYESLPQIRLLNDIDSIPSWARGVVDRTQRSLSRLISATNGADASHPVDGHIYVKVADCLNAVGGPEKQVNGSTEE